MNKQLKTAIDMIAQGYDLHLVLDISGVDPDLLMDVLVSMLAEPEYVEMKVVETLQQFNSDSIGMFRVNMN